jgi:hypothetical protein
MPLMEDVQLQGEVAADGRKCIWGGVFLFFVSHVSFLTLFSIYR